jgi:hypothetical protein
MNNNWLPEKVICIKSHPHGAVQAGMIYPLLAVSRCKCGPCVDVGIRGNHPSGTMCGNCGQYHPENDVWWLLAERFRPLDTLTETIERIEKEGSPLETVVG